MLLHDLLCTSETSAGVVASEEESHREQQAQILDFTFAELEREIEQIHALGCILRNVREGWVDFLSRRGAQWIYFCWRRGEKSVQFYHPAVRGAAIDRYPLA